MIVHLVDGTYELFRHFYGLRRFTKGVDRPYGAVVGVLQTVLQMIDDVKGSASRGQSVEGLDSHRQGRRVSRRRYRPRDRVVSQSALAGLQNRGRHRARAARAIPSPRGGAGGDGRCRLADDRARSR